jgi:hypothetical protein
MLIDFKTGATGIVLRLKVLSTATPGTGLTGLTGASTGLVISTIADAEAAATVYTAAASTIAAVATLGAYVAPTAGQCNFAQVDATNHPGVYELQLANGRFAVAGAKSLLVSLHGAANMADCDFVVPLRGYDPFAALATGDTSGRGTLAPGSLASVATQVWQDATKADFTVPGSTGYALSSMLGLAGLGSVSDTAPSSSSFLALLPFGAPANPAVLIGNTLTVTSSPTAGAFLCNATITSYTQVDSTHARLGFSTPLAVAPATNDLFSILPA